MTPDLAAFLNRPRTARDLTARFGLEWLPALRAAVRTDSLAAAWGTDNENRAWYWRERSRDAPALEALLDRLGIDERGAVR